jgi:hypothetical protein
MAKITFRLGPGFYNIQIGLCTIENIYLERVKMEVN